MERQDSYPAFFIALNRRLCAVVLFLMDFDRVILH